MPFTYCLLTAINWRKTVSCTNAIAFHAALVSNIKFTLTYFVYYRLLICWKTSGRFPGCASAKIWKQFEAGVAQKPNSFLWYFQQKSLLKHNKTSINKKFERKGEKKVQKEKQLLNRIWWRTNLDWHYYPIIWSVNSLNLLIVVDIPIIQNICSFSLFFFFLSFFIL